MFSGHDDAFRVLFSSGIRQMEAREMENALTRWKDGLLEATLTGDYEKHAIALAEYFWGSATEDRIFVVEEFKEVFAALTAICPALREPLGKALDDANPYKDLLPPLPVEHPALAPRGAPHEQPSVWPFENPARVPRPDPALTDADGGGVGTPLDH